jgi:hypothetical protein
VTSVFDVHRQYVAYPAAINAYAKRRIPLR